MDQKEKKASDLLLELNAKMDQILGLLTNQDMLLKVLANKVGHLEGQKTQRPVPPSEVPRKALPVAAKTAASELAPFPGIKPGVNLNIKKEEVARRGASRKNLVNPPEPTNAQVIQKVIYQDGTTVGQAVVDVYDLEQNLLKKLRTNPAGKWSASLAPGSYIVQLFKGGMANRPPINTIYQIEVDQAAQVELEEMVVEG